MAFPTGASPLNLIEAVALDTETTGLDPQSARIVQFGTIHVSKGKTVDTSALEQVINPGVPIPPASSAIHGIFDKDAAAAPTLPKAWKSLIDAMGSRLVIGHSIGFDIAVLEAEAKRHSLPFKRPRTLCVRMLAVLVAPSLADHSLDALAGWLGLKVEHRHTALGDSQAAAGIFLALLPKLRERGIQTLAEAERAASKIGPQFAGQESAGWVMPVQGQISSRNPVLNIDSLAYRHTIGEVMAAPVMVVSNETTLKQAMDLMVKHAISSVFVADDPLPGQKIDAYGILTERDLMRKISAHGADAFAFSAGSAASRPLQTIRENAFVYRAVGRMARLKYRHLAVRNEEGSLTGIVSARDLLKVRAGPAMVLDDGIEVASNAGELGKAWAMLPTAVNSLMAHDSDARTVCRIVSEEIRSMTRRAAVLAQAEMQNDGLGGPPCPYSVLVLGSGGRGESMLVPDQDNAIVFAEGEPDGSQDKWFAEMAARFSQILDRAGIPLCKGGVMARNAQWRGSLATWKGRITDWIGQSSPQDLLNVDIFYDAMPVHGDLSLGNDLFIYAYDAGSQNTGFAKLLGESAFSVPNPVTMFGGFRAEGNRLDLKKYILFPISSAARTLAIRHNLQIRSTRERLETVRDMGMGSERDFNALIDAHRLGLQLVLAQQAQAVEDGLKPDNDIDLASLNRAQKSDLKEAFGKIQVIPEMLRDLMFATA